MDWIHLLFGALAAGATGLAWGYRGQAELEKEQVTYLRRQLGDAPPPAHTRTLVPHQGGGRQ